MSLKYTNKVNGTSSLPKLMYSIKKEGFLAQKVGQVLLFGQSVHVLVHVGEAVSQGPSRRVGGHVGFIVISSSKLNLVVF